MLRLRRFHASVDLIFLSPHLLRARSSRQLSVSPQCPAPFPAPLPMPEPGPSRCPCRCRCQAVASRIADPIPVASRLSCISPVVRISPVAVASRIASRITLPVVDRTALRAAFSSLLSHLPSSLLHVMSSCVGVWSPRHVPLYPSRLGPLGPSASPLHAKGVDYFCP